MNFRYFVVNTFEENQHFFFGENWQKTTYQVSSVFQKAFFIRHTFEKNKTKFCFKIDKKVGISYELGMLIGQGSRSGHARASENPGWACQKFFGPGRAYRKCLNCQNFFGPGRACRKFSGPSRAGHLKEAFFVFCYRARWIGGRIFLVKIDKNCIPSILNFPKSFFFYTPHLREK